MHKTPLDDDQLLITSGLFAETLWVEANEVGLSPTRFRPTMQEIRELRRGDEDVANAGEGPACIAAPIT